MKTLTHKLALFAVLVSTCWSAAQAQPDMEGYWTVMFAPSPEGEALKAKLPENAVFIDDAGGGELAAGDFSGLVLSETAKQEVANYDFAQELSRDFACTQPSVAFYMQAPFPFELYQSDKFIAMKFEYFDMFRVIFLDGRGHPPADAPHSKSGHSIGHWEGDELVVDTTHLAEATFMNNGFNHSENLHLTERFKLSSDGTTLFATQVSEDPEVFTGLAARYMAWRKVPGEYVYPYECDPSFGE